MREISQHHHISLHERGVRTRCSGKPGVEPAQVSTLLVSSKNAQISTNHFKTVPLDVFMIFIQILLHDACSDHRVCIYVREISKYHRIALHVPARTSPDRQGLGPDRQGLGPDRQGLGPDWQGLVRTRSGPARTRSGPARTRSYRPGPARTAVPQARTGKDYGPRGQDRQGPARTTVLEARTGKDYGPTGQDCGGLWS